MIKSRAPLQEDTPVEWMVCFEMTYMMVIVARVTESRPLQGWDMEAKTMEVRTMRGGKMRARVMEVTGREAVMWSS